MTGGLCLFSLFFISVIISLVVLWCVFVCLCLSFPLRFSELFPCHYSLRRKVL
jgi:hypothetical protein